MLTRLRNRFMYMPQNQKVVLGVFMMIAVLILVSTTFNASPSAKEQAIYQKQESYYAKTNRWHFKAIADMDHNSKVKGESDKDIYWRSYLRSAELKRDPDTGKYSIEWKNKREVRGYINEKGRAMELSTLVSYHDKLYTCCDRTGIVYELKENGEKVTAIPRHILMDGNGDETKGFKCEWSTVKDDQLYIGSFGKEWTTDAGEVVNSNPQWVKRIDGEGRVEHINWRNYWESLRARTGSMHPGYMFHESVHWHPVHRRWFFMPRRFSLEGYDPKLDETRGANLILSASEDFSDVSKVTVKTANSENTRGFSCFRFIPGRMNEIIAIKSKEIDNEAWSYIMIVNLNGDVLMEETMFDEGVKFEGIEFTQ